MGFIHALTVQNPLTQIQFLTAQSNPSPYPTSTSGDVSCGVQVFKAWHCMEPIVPPRPQISILSFLQDQSLMCDFGGDVDELAHAAKSKWYRTIVVGKIRAIENLGR